MDHGYFTERAVRLLPESTGLTIRRLFSGERRLQPHRRMSARRLLASRSAPASNICGLRIGLRVSSISMKTSAT